MQLDGVDVFVRVVEAGGFSAAARLLGMPATTVSAKIARLEERLRTTLIHRSTRRMHVTAAGEAYYRHCRDAMAALAAGEDELAAATEEPSGLLRITAPSDISQILLPSIIERYLKRYPKTSVEVIATNAQLDLLAEGVDLALRASANMKDSTLQSRRFGAATLKLFASADYLAVHGTPVTPADLAGHQVMVHSRFPVVFLRMSDERGSFDLTPTGRAKADDMQTLRALAVRGTGIALLPDFPGGPGDELDYVLPDYGTASGSLYFVFPGGKFTPVNVRAFIDLAVEMRRD
ncbi:MAG: LysR family transcriptional regulator [Devosia sp.]